MPYNRLQSAPYLFAGIAEGITISSLYSYGPLYMRTVLEEPSLSVASLTIGLASFAQFVMAGVWGRWGDRIGKSALLVSAGMTLGGLSLFALPLVEGAMAFIVFTVLAAIGMAASAPLGVAWLTLHEPEQPGLAAARFYRARTVGWALGSYGTSYVVENFQIHGLSVIFQLSALFCIAVAIWQAITASRQQRLQAKEKLCGQNQPQADRTNIVETLDASSMIVWRQPLVLAVAVAVLLGFGGNEAFFAMMGPYFTEYLQGSASWVGIALGTASLAGVVVIGLVGRLADKRGPALVFTLGSFGYAAVFFLMTLLRYPLPTIILFTVPLYPFMATGVTGLMVQHIPAAQRAEAIGVYEGSAALATSIGSVVGGAVADLLGLAMAPVLALIMTAGGALVAWFGVIRIIRSHQGNLRGA